MPKISLPLIRELLDHLGMESRLGEWTVPNKVWAFKTAPPTTGGMYVAITQCLHAVHIAASTHDHVCILVF